MKSQTTPSENSPLRVALFEESCNGKTAWVAQCLDFDLVAQGPTLPDAQERFKRTLIAHVCLSYRYTENPFSNCIQEVPKSITAPKPAECLPASRMLRNLNISFSSLANAKVMPAL
jgi:hypothetical protein